MTIKITKFDHLTNEELVHHAYAVLTDEDELGLTLMMRLQEALDEIDLLKADHDAELAYLDDKLKRLQKEGVQ